MIFCIITHVNHYKEQRTYFAYAPYVREMNIWLKYVDQVIVVAPAEKYGKSPIDTAYEHDQISFYRISPFDVTRFKNALIALFQLPILFLTLYKAMKRADHIHLRCPGNMGLLGCVVQILFPRKKKTAKYAGNWDPKAKQPWSYKLQRWLLSNTFLTRNMQVLVYGEWENQTPNIKPFFTATYSETEALPKRSRDSEDIKLLFAGTLSPGKRPLYVIQIAEALHRKNIRVQLELCGDGVLRKELEAYIQDKGIGHFVFLRGNLAQGEIKNKYQICHFLVLPSKSEGWPKVVAEAMFWGCVPVGTEVSCVANMIENRGILLSLDLETDARSIISHIDNPAVYLEKSERAVHWSRQYTTEKFEAEIQKLVIPV